MNYFDPKHLHEPEISPQFDVDGRCLICLMICERDNAIRELNIEKKIAQKACLKIARLERQRDEARERNAKLLEETITYWKERERIALNAASEHSESLSKLHRRTQRVEAQNAKLRDIAKRAIETIPYTEGYGEFSYAAAVLRAELDQLKEGGK